VNRVVVDITDDNLTLAQEGKLLEILDRVPPAPKSKIMRLGF
jgi:hypothetical protein